MKSLSNETLQRLARQLAETNPGTVVSLGNIRQPAQGEKEKA